MPLQSEWTRNDGAVPLTLQVQFNFIPVSGIEPTVEVVRFDDFYVADWSTNTFVQPGTAASGQGTMDSIPSGTGDLYFRSFNPNTFGDAAGRQIYWARFRATIPSGFRSSVSQDINLSSHEVISFQPLASGLASQNFLTATLGCE